MRARFIFLNQSNCNIQGNASIIPIGYISDEISEKSNFWGHNFHPRLYYLSLKHCMLGIELLVQNISHIFFCITFVNIQYLS